MHGKNNFAEISKISIKKKLNIDLRIILSDYQNNFVECKHNEQCCKKFRHSSNRFKRPT